MTVERDENFKQAVRNGILLIAGICLAVAIGTFGLVKLFGLDGGQGDAPTVDEPAAPRTPLPSSALPVPGQSESADPELAPKTPSPKGLRLAMTPASVNPMERINITGTYQGQDAIQLQIQRRENGKWTDFPIEVQVRAGSFSTYIMTGRVGENSFRVFDPKANKASNVVVVTVNQVSRSEDDRTSEPQPSPSEPGRTHPGRGHGAQKHHDRDRR